MKWDFYNMWSIWICGRRKKKWRHTFDRLEASASKYWRPFQATTSPKYGCVWTSSDGAAQGGSGRLSPVWIYYTIPSWVKDGSCVPSSHQVLLKRSAVRERTYRLYWNNNGVLLDQQFKGEKGNRWERNGSQTLLWQSEYDCIPIAAPDALPDHKYHSGMAQGNLAKSLRIRSGPQNTSNPKPTQQSWNEIDFPLPAMQHLQQRTPTESRKRLAVDRNKHLIRRNNHSYKRIPVKKVGDNEHGWKGWGTFRASKTAKVL